MQLLATRDFIVCNWQEAAGQGSLDEQLDGLLDSLRAALQAHGVPFARLLKHTIAIRDGAVDPLQAINGFHRKCHALAPDLVDAPSVGTIFRVPAFREPGTLVAIEAVFARHPDAIRRVPFADPEMADVARALEYRGRMFLTGFEALEKKSPDGGFTPDNLDVRESLQGQADVVVDKIAASLESLGSDVSAVRQLNLYLRADQDGESARALVTQALARRAPDAAIPAFDVHVMRGHGMVMDSFKIEIDGLAIAQETADLHFSSTAVPAHESICRHGARCLAEQLRPALTSRPQALKVVVKHTSSHDAFVWDDFEACLRTALGRVAPTSISAQTLHVAKLGSSAAAAELDASLFST